MITSSLSSYVNITGTEPPKKWKVYASCQADERAIVHPRVGSLYSYYLFGLDEDLTQPPVDIHQRHMELTEQGVAGHQTPTQRAQSWAIK